ncbi:hypothetical protein [Beijerinckia sp. L45]|uniref:hypothetical protein n=1 Tax=Beijerinckia sp. L45 TaxID=1641855 RepID=UPI00131C57EC|nr:hypothetical protein [Beijerinckia sp. L45]
MTHGPDRIPYDEILLSYLEGRKPLEGAAAASIATYVTSTHIVRRLRTALCGLYLSDTFDYRELRSNTESDWAPTPSDKTLGAELTVLREACRAFCATHGLRHVPLFNIPARGVPASRGLERE